MEFKERTRKKILRILKQLLPLLVPAVICLVFILAISAASGTTASEEENNLKKALARSAVASYARDGVYPESLDTLLEEYNITYDKKRFVVDYEPYGSNLFPSISVITLKSGKGGTS